LTSPFGSKSHTNANRPASSQNSQIVFLLLSQSSLTTDIHRHHNQKGDPLMSPCSLPLTHTVTTHTDTVTTQTHTRTQSLHTHTITTQTHTSKPVSPFCFSHAKNTVYTPYKHRIYMIIIKPTYRSITHACRKQDQEEEEEEEDPLMSPSGSTPSPQPPRNPSRRFSFSFSSVPHVAPGPSCAPTPHHSPLPSPSLLSAGKTYRLQV
jgi:hypothetical protein